MRRDARQQSDSSDSDLLKAVRDGFARFRGARRGSRDRFPDEIRSLVLAAVKAGHPRGEVADAAGIDRSAIGRWQREVQKMPANAVPTTLRELRIVKGHEDLRPQETLAGGAVAVMRIGSGITIHLPLEALTENFLRTLMTSDGGAR